MFSFSGIEIRFKKTTMIMHHKFCLIDARDLKPEELKVVESRRRKREKNQENLAKIGKTLPDIEQPPQIPLPPQGVLITGSCNWTMQGFAGNWENVVFTSHESLIRRFQGEFNGIWADFGKAASTQRR